MTVFTVAQTVKFIQNRFDLSDKDKTELLQTIDKYSDPLLLKLSHAGWEHIKNEEKLRLTAYSIGDGMVTVGYGHASPLRKSKIRVGQKISEEQANQYLIKDVNIAAEGVKRMFKQWKQKGINVKITQNQYDVLVSMAFNMGISSFRKSEFIQTLKHNDLEKAAELIKVTGVNDKFAGLETRRLTEYQKFIT